MVIWIIGQSGSGKTFLAKKLYNKMKLKKKIHLDGDQIRNIFFDNKLGYKIKDREQNAKLIVKLCKFFEQKGFTIICSIQSIFPKMQKNNRTLFKKYFQVFIDVPPKILIQRNNKKVYSKKNVVGIDFKFPKPYKNDYKFINNFDQKYKSEVNKILKKISYKSKFN